MAAAWCTLVAHTQTLPGLGEREVRRLYFAQAVESMSFRPCSNLVGTETIPVVLDMELVRVILAAAAPFGAEFGMAALKPVVSGRSGAFARAIRWD